MNTNIDRQDMRDYLLGTLAAERRAELEEKILCDPKVFEEILLCEEELIDQYVTGALSNDEWQQFQSHFLITAERQRGLRFGKLLRRYIDSHPVLAPEVAQAVGEAGKAAPAQRSLPFYLARFSQTHALALSAAVVVFLGVISLAWLALRKPAEITPRQGAERLQVLKLVPGSMRSAGVTQRVKVLPRGVDLKLELEVTNPTFDNYKSQLFRENEPLKMTAELRMEPGEQHIVPLTIPGEILSPGDYQVRLSGILDSGEDEFIDNYSFRVTTE